MITSSRIRAGMALAVVAMSGCAQLGSPIPRGAVAVDEGEIGAKEGPAWHDGSLYFTDGTQIRRQGPDGTTTIWRSAAEAGGANGLAFDREGRLIACESAQRRLTRTEADGRITVLADNLGGRKFNSPNDVALDTRGRIYFTDPRYGNRVGMEIEDAPGQKVDGVYRIDAPGVVSRLATPEVERPNGLFVSPGDRYLFICDNNNGAGGSRKLVRFGLRADGSLDPASRTVVFDWGTGRGGDGMKMDEAGRIYVVAGLNQASRHETTEFRAGCYIFSPEGERLAFIPTAPDGAANCAFGGADRSTLFITSGRHLWSIRLQARGYWAADAKQTR